jgi:hypothetical protein
VRRKELDEIFRQPKVKQILIEKIAHSLNVSIDSYMFRNMTIDEVFDFETAAFSRQFNFYLTGKRWEKVISNTQKVPNTWWDAFKERFFPAFLLKVFPAEHREIMTTVAYHVTRVCPHLDAKEDWEHLVFLAEEGDDNAGM